MAKKELKYIKCPTFIFSMNMNDNGKGDGTDKLMLFMLMSLGDDSKNYNQEQLGRMIGCSSMTAGKCLHRLEENGYITVTKGKFDPKTGCKTKNTFKVNMDYITSLASDKDYFISKEVETPKEEPVEIEQLPNLSPKENDTDLDEMNFKEIDFNEHSELSFLNEDDEMPTIDKFINRLSKLEYQSTAYWTEMKKIMSEVPSGMKSFYNEEISRIMKKQAA